MKTISILGCGWVGQALKEQLQKTANTVSCLTRDIETNSIQHLYTCDVFIIAIPPSTDHYLEVLKDTLLNLDKDNLPLIIFLSSISFYDNKPLVVEAEKYMEKTLETFTLSKKLVILRLGGLMGYTRVAGKYTAGKTLKANAGTNYVHRDDVVGVIEKIIVKGLTKGTYDLVAPMQSTKKEIFLQNAKVFGFEVTKFEDATEPSKRLDAHKLCGILDYTFQKKDVRSFWKTS